MRGLLMKQRALSYLQTALASPQATFHDGQWECIEKILSHHRVLCVQRTGWGKSMVYFLATKLMREQGAGTTLLVSPLLSLMRNQQDAAKRIGITARTINSTNKDDWNLIQGEIFANKVDLLLISPERLANEEFRQTVLPKIIAKAGLLVIDEAHCISDWGHDFRPDYRRIVRILQAMPPNVPVLATTATANNRVVSDVCSQLGAHIETIRGSLTRKSLKLQNINLPDPAERMAWLAQTIPTLPGSGIVYTLTQRDAEQVTQWLTLNHINARAYHAGVENREQLEQQLLNNEIKVLVATVALGMGFDKPDLEFVIHFQRPSSVVHYYQQVGRAGRAVEEAYGILLCGEEDDHIADYFIHSAFPPQHHVASILGILDQSDNGLSTYEMQARLNIGGGNINKALKFLTVESPSPIVKVDRKWRITAAAANYSINQDHIDGIIAIRKQEQQQMRDYMSSKGCLMKFLGQALDDPNPANCGQCKNCAPEKLLPESVDSQLAQKATFFLCGTNHPIAPRLKGPDNRKIPTELRMEEGRALCYWRDAGWGKLVAEGKLETEHFSDDLVSACVRLLREWNPSPAPCWVTCIPSLRRPTLVPDFAKRLADGLGLPFNPCIVKVHENVPQKKMENSFQQRENLKGVFQINLPKQPYGPCLLVDDVVDSRWTFTVAAAQLLQSGCTAVIPLALAVNTTKMD